MKFSHKVVVASSILLLSAIFVITAQQVMITQKILASTVTQGVDNAMVGLSSHLSRLIHSQKSFATYVTEIASEDTDLAAMEDLIRKESLQEAFILVGGGLETDRGLLRNKDSWNPGPKWDARNRSWYKEVKAKNETILTEPYVDFVTGEVVSSIATPLRKDGEFVGSLFFDISLTDLSALINEANLFDSGFLFVVSSNDTIIAHPDAEVIGQSFSSLQEQFIDIFETKPVIINIDNTRFTYRFKKVPDTDWYIGAVVDKNAAFQSIRGDMRNSTILFTVIGLIMSIVILLFIIQKLMRPLRALNRAIQNIATGQGDLTQRLEVNTDPEFSELAEGFNTFNRHLQCKIKLLKGINHEIMKTSEEASKGTSETAEAMSNQLHEIEQLATAMNEMVTTSNDMASNAQGAASAAQEADDATMEGSTIVSYTAQSIDELSANIDEASKQVRALVDSTDSIETVLQVITEIADQTNLLALNAAIEAARAGDQGRGFAVVADEVRTLSQKTQESTTEIHTMIEQLQSGASAVVKAMDTSKEAAVNTVIQAQEANGALERIKKAIQHITDMNIQIASAAEEQSLVAEEININTFKIKKLSGQVSEFASNSNLEIQTQSENVRKQGDIMNQFIV